MATLVRATRDLLRDESGQDLIEYGLLTAFIGLVGFVVWEQIRGGIGLFYSNADAGTQDMWHPQDPNSGQGYKSYK